VMQSAVTPDGKCFYKSSFQCAYQLQKEHGMFNGLFRGTGATMGREVCQTAVYYPVYEACKKLLTPADQNTRDLSPGLIVVAGMVAGCSQWVPPLYWIDVVKSRIQAETKQGRSLGMIECAVKMYTTEGVSVFFKGITPALIRAGPLHGMIFVSYEM